MDNIGASPGRNSTSRVLEHGPAVAPRGGGLGRQPGSPDQSPRIRGRGSEFTDQERPPDPGGSDLVGRTGAGELQNWPLVAIGTMMPPDALDRCGSIMEP